jgi:flagellar basal-body rod modification protein FlgD
MQISATSPLQNTLASTGATPSQADAVLSSDFETFLKMLTAQARYQDPLEPIDSSQYAAQLAQFSMVEQQVLSNDLLTALGNQLGAGTMAQTAGWIGMEARSSAAVEFTGAPITIIPSSSPGADEAVLVAYDSSGAEVQRQQIPTGSQPIEWAGVSNTGAPFPPGLYTFKVESLSVGQPVGTADAQSFSRIVEARRQGAETVLILQGGASLSVDQIEAIREPR